jgi:hypothetical protein
MLRAAVLGVIAAAAAIAQAPVSAPSLGIFLGFEIELSRASLDAMKTEVARIMRPTGLVLYWRSLQANQGAETFSDIAVIQFHGRCEASGKQIDATPGSEHSLATTLVKEGSVLPYSNIACEQIMQVVPDRTGDKQKAIGRILGLVVAHELYHSLTNVTQHALRGIAKSTHSGRDLVTGLLTFDEDTLSKIQESHLR